MTSALIPNWETEGLPCVITENQITITLPNGKPVSVPSTDQLRFNGIKDAIREGKWEDVPLIADKGYAIKVKTNGQFDVREDDRVWIDDRQLPEALSKRLLAMIQEGLSVDPLLKFWDNLLLNPSYKAVQELYAFLEKNNHPISSDGCFWAYRSVRSDWMDKHTGTISNKPCGKPVSMPRNEVDEDSNRDCSKGLHVANYDYAKSFGGGDDRLLAVKVNPKDVVAIPVTYQASKMRVCEFLPVEEITDEIDKVVYDEPDEPDDGDDDYEGDDDYKFDKPSEE